MPRYNVFEKVYSYVKWNIFYSYSMWAIMWMFLKVIRVYNVDSALLEVMIAIVINDVLPCLNMKINKHNQQWYY